MDGLVIGENAMSFMTVRLHYSADPDKNPDNADPERAEKARTWLNAQRALWPDPNDFEREFEINWHVGIGTRVFPQFSETYHVVPLKANRRKVIYRSWDFGWHAPVCLVAQVDPKERLLLLHEIIGAKQSTRDFAQHVIKKCAEWFPLYSAGFEDYCDPAGQQVRATDNDANERRDVEILNGLGIYPKFEYGWSRKDGRSLVHQLLALRTDGSPGIFVDGERCPLTMQSFLGQYVYKQSQDGRVKDDPDDETHPWADIMAAFRYLCVGLQAKLGLRRFRFSADTAIASGVDPGYHGYGTVRQRR